MNENFGDKLIEQQEEKKTMMPLGLTPLKKKPTSSKSRLINTDSAAYKLKAIIRDKVPKGEEFVTSYISEDFLSLGYSSSDLSGQMYALRKSGKIVNRKLEDEQDIAIYGKGVRIWRATDEFYEYMENIVND